MPFSLQAYVILYQVHASREGVMVEGGERGEMPEESEIDETGTKMDRGWLKGNGGLRGDG